MKVCVIGTGAIGGYYGGRLAKAGHELHFLAHSDFTEMSRNGLRVDSCLGNFIIEHPNVYHSTAEMPVADLVIVALKTTNNHLLPTLLPPVCGPDTIVLLIQNGLCVETDVKAQMPSLQLAAGLAFICSTKVGPAHVSHQDYGGLTLANHSVTNAERMTEIANIFIEAGVKTDIVDYDFGRWRKAIWNLPFNGLTVTLNTDTATLVSHPDTLALCRAIMHEVVAIANAIGVDRLNERHIETNIESTQKMKPYAPSMKVDFDHHRPMEVYYLYTRAIIEAHRHNVPCPHLEQLEQQLQRINKEILTLGSQS